MDKTEIRHQLNYVDHSRDKRMEMTGMVLQSPNSVQSLIEIALEDNGAISDRACWVLEFTAKNNIQYLLPYVDILTKGLSSVHSDPSIRPMAKICERLVILYFSKTGNKVRDTLAQVHLERITTACFDWLIGNHKVAAQAYSMTSLLLLGRKFNWIHPELKLILEQNYAQGSAAYKARARMTLARIK